MRHIHIIFILVLFSCGHKKEKTPIDIAGKESEKIVETKQNTESVFYNDDNNLRIFDFNQLPLSKDIDDISNNDTEKYNIDEWLRKKILEKENYYKLVNYNKISSNKDYI